MQKTIEQRLHELRKEDSSTANSKELQNLKQVIHKEEDKIKGLKKELEKEIGYCTLLSIARQQQDEALKEYSPPTGSSLVQKTGLVARTSGSVIVGASIGAAMGGLSYLIYCAVDYIVSACFKN